MKPEDLITYCGLYDGTCARWCEYSAFRDLAAVLAEWVDAQGFHHWMPDAVKEFDYTGFRKALDFFSRQDTWLVCRRCCKGGDGRPDCPIRICCHHRGLDLCFDCDEFPCDKVKGDARLIERATEYRELGRGEWLRQQVEKAEQGFELHTAQYYQIRPMHNPTAQELDEGAGQ